MKMRISKGQGISLFASIITFGVLSIVVFLLPLTHTINFWLGYFFAVFALITMVLVLALYFAKPVKEEKFLSLPAVNVAWTYYVLQMALSIWEMVSFPLPYMATLVINFALGAVFSIIALALYAVSERIDNAEQYTAEKVEFVKRIKLRLESIETTNLDLDKRIKELAEDVRFSDPMSHSKITNIEEAIVDVVDKLVENAGDTETAFSLCNQAAKLLKNRNDQCKALKSVKDIDAENAKKSANGMSIALAGVSVVVAICLITLTVCFVVIPQAKYTAASNLFEVGKYDEAAAAFRKLGNFRDSEDKEAKIKTILNDKAYEQAERLFGDGEYKEALKIYKELDGYKDSKGRIEEINNRLSTGNIIYFGTYNGEPIAWQIVKNEGDKQLLLVDKTIKNLPVNSELKIIEFEDSALNVWLNEEFVADFTDEQKDRIIKTHNYKVLLLDEKLASELKEANIDLSADVDYWISTKSDKGFKFISKSGEINNEGDLVIRDKGIRPVIWINIEGGD